jgi:iron complex outermembrane recepter protein
MWQLFQFNYGFFPLAGLVTDDAALKGREFPTGCVRDRRREHRTGCRVALAVAVCLLWAMPAAVSRAAEPLFDIDIPAMNAAEALNRLADQTGSVMLFSYDLASVRQANAVRGRYTLLRGLELLLRDTGLSGGLSEKRVVIIAQTENSPEGGGESVDTETTKKRRFLAGLVAAILGGGAADARADQEATAAPPPQLGEVLVTAQKREEQVENVPLSISVLSGQNLDRTTLSVTDEIGRTPGLVVSQTSLGGQSFSVRGVAAPSLFTGTSVVGYYLDSVPFGFIRQGVSPDSSAYDLDRIEVLRGPQGTLYGVSAINGVIRVLTAEPDLNNYELKTRLTGSETLDGGENYRADVAANAPLVPGKFAVRAVVGYEDASGWIDRSDKSDVNGSINLNLRLQLRAQPTEKLSLNLMGWRSDIDRDGRNISHDDRTTGMVIPEPSTEKFDAFGFRLGYDFDNFYLSSSTSYIDYKIDSIGTLGGDSTFTLVNKFYSEVLSEEINLVSTGQGPWRWTLGGIYRDAEDVTAQNLPELGVILGWNPQGSIYKDFSKSYAIFGELTRSFLDGRWELTGGLRYFEDSADMKQIANLFDSSAVLLTEDNKYEALSPRVVLTWHPVENLTTYASYSEGFRSGFAQSPFVLAVDPTVPTVDSDNLTNYELGIKGGGSDRFSFDAAVFYEDWQDIQQALVIATPLLPSGIGISLNGGSASGVGAEFGLSFRPIDGLNLGVTYSWNDLGFDEDVVTGVPPAVIIPEGQRPDGSHEHTAGASADYSFTIGNRYESRLSGSVNYISASSGYAIISGQSEVFTGDDLLIARLSFGVSTPAGLSTTLFIENLTDENGKDPTLADPVSAIQGAFGRIRPRTIGLQFEYRL